jgi:arsenite methyltransferase
LKATVSRGYSMAAAEYDLLASHLYLTGLRRLLPLIRLPLLPAILDVGCGTGANLLEAGRRFGPVSLLHGIDIAPGMVGLARIRAAAAGVRAHFTVADAEQLPFPDRTFDLVICNSVLHWFEDRLQALREMHRVLKPGGFLMVICAAEPAYREWFDLMELALLTVLGHAAPSVRLSFTSAPELLALLLTAGFRPAHLRQHHRRELVTDPVGFLRLMRAAAPHWRADLSPTLEQAVDASALRLMLLNQPFPCTWSALEAIAVRTDL